MSDNDVTASNPNYVIDVAYSNFGNFNEGINTKLTITKRKLKNFDLKVTSTDVPEGSTGTMTKEFPIDSNVIASDKGKVFVKVTFDASILLTDGALGLNRDDGYDRSGEAKIEFKTDGGSDAYKNYEFDTASLGSISLQK